MKVALTGVVAMEIGYSGYFLDMECEREESRMTPKILI